MSKVLLRVVSLFFVAGLFVPLINTKAYEISVDQQNTVVSGSSVTIASFGHNQTFAPLYDVLTSLRVYLKDRRGGSNITLTVKDSSDQLVLTKTQRMADGTGWEEFNFVDDALGYKLTPKSKYSIWLETDYYTDAPVPKWVRSGTDAYARGERRQNSTVYSDDDFAFATFGYSTLGDEQDPLPDPGSDPLPEDPQDPEDEPSDGPDDSQDDDVTIQIQEDQNDEEAEGTAQDAISLDYIEKDGEVYELEGDSIEIKLSEKLVLYGSAMEDTELLIFLGDFAEENVVTDSFGAWSLEIDLGGYVVGDEFWIAAKYKNAVEENVLAQLSIVDEDTNDSNELKVRENDSDENGYSLGLILVGVCSLLGLIVLIMAIVFRKRLRKLFISFSNRNGASEETSQANS